MSVVIECPSGMQLKIRGLKGKESKLLADPNAWRSGTFIDQLLNACTEELIDAGPYPFENNKVDWGKALVGDRFFAFLQIRIVTFGSAYGFQTQCREIGCRARFEYEVDLANDLAVKRFSDEDRDTFVSGGTFTTTLTDGREVRYKLMTGADERMLAKSRSAERGMVDALARKVVSIEGVGDVTMSDIANQRTVKQVRQYLEEMEFRELVHLLDACDEHDCGVDPKIEIQCPDCGGIQQQTLPLEQTFFRPNASTSLKARA